MQFLLQNNQQIETLYPIYFDPSKTSDEVLIEWINTYVDTVRENAAKLTDPSEWVAVPIRFSYSFYSVW